VARSALGTSVHFLSILLIFENDGHELSQGEELGVGIFEDATGSCSKDNAAESNLLGAVWMGSFREFTGAHGEEEGS
jgi:hypothetical protein